MPIKTPKERAFYYEITNLRDRLIYWIPKEDLKDMEKNGKMSKQLLEDYPFGLDVEVYQDLFDEFKKKYRLEIPIDVENTMQAFQAIKNRYGKKFPRTGLINVKELQSFAQEMKFELERTPELRLKELPGVKKRAPDKKSFRQQQILQRKTESYTKKFEFKRLDVKAPIKKQPLFKVIMTGGEDAFDALSKLHQHKMKR